MCLLAIYMSSLDALWIFKNRNCVILYIVFCYLIFFFLKISWNSIHVHPNCFHWRKVVIFILACCNIALWCYLLQCFAGYLLICVHRRNFLSAFAPLR